MRVLIFLFLYLSCKGFSQENDTGKVDRIIGYFNDFNAASNVLQESPSKQNFKNLEKALFRMEKNYTEDTAFLSNYLRTNYTKGNKCYESGEMDSAAIYFTACHNVVSQYKKIEEFDYVNLYRKLLRIFGEKDTLKATEYFFLSIDHGNDAIEDITDWFRYKKYISEDSLLNILHLFNVNYINASISAAGDIEIIYRYIIFMDQYYRTRCYFHREFNYSVVQRNDSALQSLFESLLPYTGKLNLHFISPYQSAFSILLLHSVSTPNSTFFEKYFHIFSDGIFNNYKDVNALKSLIDIYLKFKRNKQYFNTDFGSAILSDGKRGLLLRITDEEMKQLFIDLKVQNPVY